MALLADPLKLLIVCGDFYRHISDELIAGATEALDASHVEYAVARVPGALEIPSIIGMAEIAAARPAGHKYDGYVALGAIIRGETNHHDIVCRESTRAIMDMTVRGIAIGNGILFTENEAQAIARASRKDKNKGKDAAVACLTMIEVRKRLNMGSI